MTLPKVLGASISAYDVSLLFEYPGTFEARVAVELWMISRWTEPWPKSALRRSLSKKKNQGKKKRDLRGTGHKLGNSFQNGIVRLKATFFVIYRKHQHPLL